MGGRGVKSSQEGIPLDLTFPGLATLRNLQQPANPAKMGYFSLMHLIPLLTLFSQGTCSDKIEYFLIEDNACNSKVDFPVDKWLTLAQAAHKHIFQRYGISDKLESVDEYFAFIIPETKMGSLDTEKKRASSSMTVQRAVNLSYPTPVHYALLEKAKPKGVRIYDIKDHDNLHDAKFEEVLCEPDAKQVKDLKITSVSKPLYMDVPRYKGVRLLPDTFPLHLLRRDDNQLSFGVVFANRSKDIKLVDFDKKVADKTVPLGDSDLYGNIADGLATKEHGVVFLTSDSTPEKLCTLPYTRIPEKAEVRYLLLNRAGHIQFRDSIGNVDYIKPDPELSTFEAYINQLMGPSVFYNFNRPYLGADTEFFGDDGKKVAQASDFKVGQIYYINGAKTAWKTTADRLKEFEYKVIPYAGGDTSALTKPFDDVIDFYSNDSMAKKTLPYKSNDLEDYVKDLVPDLDPSKTLSFTSQKDGPEELAQINEKSSSFYYKIVKNQIELKSVHATGPSYFLNYVPYKTLGFYEKLLRDAIQNTDEFKRDPIVKLYDSLPGTNPLDLDLKVKGKDSVYYYNTMPRLTFVDLDDEGVRPKHCGFEKDDKKLEDITRTQFGLKPKYEGGFFKFYLSKDKKTLAENPLKEAPKDEIYFEEIYADKEKKEKEEKERLEKERLDKEKLEKERLEKLEKEKLDKEKPDKEKKDEKEQESKDKPQDSTGRNTNWPSWTVIAKWASLVLVIVGVVVVLLVCYYPRKKSPSTDDDVKDEKTLKEDSGV